MRGRPTGFWGKLESDESGAILAWHPLADHCADVASVVEALLRLPLWRARLATLAGLAELDESQCARLSVLAALHDLGKFNLGFQAKGRPELGPTAGHVVEAVAALFKPPFLDLLRPLAAWGDGVTGLLLSAICHHGRPQGQDHDAAHQTTRWRPRAGLDPGAGAAALLADCRAWFPAAFRSDASPLPAVPALEHAFAGLVMLGDWLGSDTEHFPFSPDDPPEPRMASSRGRVPALLAKMGVDVPLVARSDAAGRDPFRRVVPPGFAPRPAQAAVLGLAEPAPGSIVALEAETGSGKTEAALAHFVRLFERGAVDGMYFALPTRTAATQLFERVHAAARVAFADPPPVVLAVPGYLRVDDAAGARLPGFEVLWPDAGGERLRFRGWAAEQPKRFMVGTIVVGTIDQVLLSSLMVGHAHLRATALLRHLLVVDEVHASDAYMTRILEEVLGRHRAAGGHALLLSATLGAETRARLLEPRRPRARVGLDVALASPYPLLSYADVTRSGTTDPMEVGVSKQVRMEPRPTLEDPEATMAEALSAARAGAKVLVIKNTVRDCLEHQQALERLASAPDRVLLFACGDVAAPHHARYARADREALDRALERTFGKARGPGGAIVVATQTVQQSLDLDADLLLTDLCPADVLLQRVGRLHRHVREGRPAGFERPRAVVLVPSDRDLGALLDDKGGARHHHGLGSVYGDLRVLEATWRLIQAEPEWSIPAGNRRYVEHSVHSEALAAIVAERGGAWPAHAIALDGRERGERRVAELNVVDWAEAYSEKSFASALDRRITSRLGEGDRRVIFAPAFVGPFGGRVGELTLRADWAKGVDPELFQAEDVRASAGATRFAFGGRRFVYDRFGVRPDQEEDSDGDGP